MIDVAVKRIRLAFLSPRFWIGFIALVVLTLLASLASSRELQQRRELYEGERARDLERVTASGLVTYNQTRVFLHRPPELLSVLARGLGERHGSVVELRGRYGRPQLTSRARSNFLLPALQNVDTSIVAALVLSLMAVLLAAEVISAEREAGTLQLAVSGGFPRWKWLTGEYLGLLATLLLPLVCSALVAGTVVVAAGGGWGGQLVLRLSLWVVALALMASVFVLLGLLVSVRARQPASALAVAFLAWAFLAVLFPAVTIWSVERLRPLDPVALVRAENAIVAETGFTGSSGRDRHRELEGFTNRNLDQAGLVARLWLAAPYSNTLLAAQRIAGTDLLAHREFLRQARRADHVLAEWQTEKVARSPHRESFFRASEGQLDLSGLPVPRMAPERTAAVASRLTVPLAVLLAWNLALFLVAQWLFFHYDLGSS
jgi:ABC-type transport system involved in multi-copper enzyme maturation permease subunit